ncbi:heme-degrading domain-containing protein [uncultured Rhodoferax sp.]|uniref:heme-degrading domain-containing protein n=1 Tax=uncultured Rhodoferax sp. TaxID=223188 RepID=UPI0025D5CB86|nr:heme-degrading domain-containing protein [uncultured Rhodoferax sp.]
MNLATDLERLALQEQRLQFDAFDQSTAWTLGTNIKALCEKAGVALAIEIRLAKDTVFYYAMPGTGPGNADWARRKRNLVELSQTSSYAIGLKLEQEKSSLMEKQGLPLRDYTAHGGSFPIRVRGVGMVGVVTVSGIPQREDHAMVVKALAELCGVSLAEVALY